MVVLTGITICLDDFSFGSDCVSLFIAKFDWVSGVIALPFIVIWASYPKIAVYTSERFKRRAYELSSKDRDLLQSYARRIWHFFETFVSKEDNYLPPDNFQEDPEPLVAHRTSPTNIGLYTISLLAAKDFGYVTERVCFEKLQATFDSLRRLERFEGHFYNWYDTQSLEPLYPKYISLVDSGNLAGYLLVVKQAAVNFQNEGLLVDANFIKGLRTTFVIIENEMSQLH